MESGPTTRRLFHLVLLCVLALATSPGPACAQVNGDPLQLQKSGIARIDHWLDHVRTTGDAVSTRDELATAQVELQTSYVLFIQRQDPAGAVWSAIKLGDIQRYVNQWPQATSVYQNAVKLAELARRTDYQTKALAELAFSEMRRGYLDDAEDHAREAVRLGANCGNTAFYFDALDTAAELETKRANSTSAGDYLNRALAMQDQIADQFRLYSGYVGSRGSLLPGRATCDSEGEPRHLLSAIAAFAR